MPEIAPDPALRADLERQAAEDANALWSRLIALDPDVVDFIDPRNVRRVIRALEVCLKTGTPILRTATAHTTTLSRASDRADDGSRRALRSRRCPRRYDDGSGIARRGPRLCWIVATAGSFRRCRDWVTSSFALTFDGEATLDDVVERIKLDTHAFIRRQYAWFRPKAEDIHWLDAEQQPDGIALAIVRDFLKSDRRQATVNSVAQTLDGVSIKAISSTSTEQPSIVTSDTPKTLEMH